MKSGDDGACRFGTGNHQQTTDGRRKKRARKKVSSQGRKGGGQKVGPEPSLHKQSFLQQYAGRSETALNPAASSGRRHFFPFLCRSVPPALPCLTQRRKRRHKKRGSANFPGQPSSCSHFLQRGNLNFVCRRKFRGRGGEAEARDGKVGCPGGGRK